MATGRLINYKWMKFYATIAAPPKVVHHSFAYTENSVIDISTSSLILLGSLVALFIFSSQISISQERNGYQNPMFVANRSGSHRLSRPSISYMTTSIRTDKWEIPAGHVIVEEWLGEGCFGEVRKGIVKGPIPNSQCMKSSICVTVAVKLLKCE